MNEFLSQIPTKGWEVLYQAGVAGVVCGFFMVMWAIDRRAANRKRDELERRVAELSDKVECVDDTLLRLTIQQGEFLTALPYVHDSLKNTASATVAECKKQLQTKQPPKHGG